MGLCNLEGGDGKTKNNAADVLIVSQVSNAFYAFPNENMYVSVYSAATTPPTISNDDFSISYSGTSSSTVTFLKAGTYTMKNGTPAQTGSIAWGDEETVSVVVGQTMHIVRGKALMVWK